MSGSRPAITRIGAYGVITQQDELLLCRLSSQVRRYQGWWTLPGGGIDFGEHPEAAMIREVEEETGLIVEATGLLGINSFEIQGEDDDFHSIQIVYRAEVVEGTLRHELEGTTDMCAWHPMQNIGSLEVVSLVEKALGFVRGTSEPLEWYEPEDDTPRELCPCCDYVTLPQRGYYLICPICYWEDDGLDLEHLDIGSPPNHGLTLREGRANFKRIGACEPEMLEHVLPEHERKRYRHVSREPQ